GRERHASAHGAGRADARPPPSAGRRDGRAASAEDDLPSGDLHLSSPVRRHPGPNLANHGFCQCPGDLNEVRALQRSWVGGVRCRLARAFWVGGACAPYRLRVGGACGPPPPVAAPLASSLRAPSRGDPPHDGPSAAGEAPAAYHAAPSVQRLPPELLSPYS